MRDEKAKRADPLGDTDSGPILFNIDLIPAVAFALFFILLFVLIWVS